MPNNWAIAVRNVVRKSWKLTDLLIFNQFTNWFSAMKVGRIRVGHGSLFQNPTQPKISGPNPTQPTKIEKSPPDPTQPIIDTWYGIPKTLYNNCYTSQTSSQSMKVIIQLQYSLADSRVFHDVKNITQSSLHPTQPNPPKIKKL